jgi:hypothetical protein
MGRDGLKLRTGLVVGALAIAQSLYEHFAERPDGWVRDHPHPDPVLVDGLSYQAKPATSPIETFEKSYDVRFSNRLFEVKRFRPSTAAMSMSLIKCDLGVIRRSDMSVLFSSNASWD